jgi:two-component system sensor histidine kinase/response regulator
VIERSAVRILIVDDNAAKRLSLKAVLSSLGHTIVEADSGVTALRALMAQDFAVILLDVRMPINDGFETAALIRQRRQSEMTPIIFITAYGKNEIVNTDLYAEGAVDFIFAPVPPDELRAKVSVFANLYLKAEELATQARGVQTSADQLLLLTDAAPIGIFQTDSENRYVYTNPRWVEITGISPEEAAGKTWETIVASPVREGLIVELPEGPVYRDELGHRFEIRTPGASARVALVTSRPIPGPGGGIAGWVGTLADITAEAEAELVISEARDKANEASRLKSDFLANMSHEIRTPMNGVIGMTDLLLETDLDARQRDYAQTVRNSGEALLTIIDAILDFSKVEAGKVEVEEVEFDVRTTVCDVVDLLASSAQIKGLELVAAIERSVPRVVRGDPGRVRQVLTNLVGNAIKFTRTGEVVVRVTESELDGTDTILRFEVSDTGDGIPPDKLDLVFQPFVQADTSTSRKYGGTGLGLAISGKLVALMGGDCGVSSRIGKGSEFWFTIRVRADEGQPRDEGFGPDPDLAGIAVLVIDDNATQRSVLGEYLTGWGMTVAAAASGAAALKKLKAESKRGSPFAVALVDRSMPGMDGLELTAAIDADPSLATRVVLMTDLGQELDVETTEPGVAASLSKPVHRNDLRTCLRVALGLREADAALVEVTPHLSSPLGEPEVGRLLLAEDNLINQKVAVAMLSGAGYHVDTVLNGAAAVQAAATGRYDAILMDCQMPELNGYEATAAIRAQEGRARHTPIIAMTAGARPEDRERCLAEGMDGYLAKPVSKEALLSSVARSVKGLADLPVPKPALHTTAGDVLVQLSDPERCVLDLELIERLGRLGRATGEDLMGELTVLFLADADTQLRGLHEAFAAGDAEAVVRWAHVLRGASANVGASGLSRLCATLESDGAEGNLVDGTPLLDAVEAELARVRLAFGSLTAPMS